MQAKIHNNHTILSAWRQTSTAASKLPVSKACVMRPSVSIRKIKIWITLLNECNKSSTKDCLHTFYRTTVYSYHHLLVCWKASVVLQVHQHLKLVKSRKKILKQGNASSYCIWSITTSRYDRERLQKHATGTKCRHNWPRSPPVSTDNGPPAAMTSKAAAPSLRLPASDKGVWNKRHS